jgi:hypothetical protein
MIGEINCDWYCVCEKDLTDDNYCLPEQTGFDTEYCINHCDKAHRKYLTLKQFKNKYGHEWEGAVYAVFDTGEIIHLEFCNVSGVSGLWFTSTVRQIEAAEAAGVCFSIVCACTPWGKPPNNWRPE